MCGDVQIGHGTFIGAGAVVVPGVRIGKRRDRGCGRDRDRRRCGRRGRRRNPARERRRVGRTIAGRGRAEPERELARRVVGPSTTLAETIERIDRSGLQVGLVVDEDDACSASSRTATSGAQSSAIAGLERAIRTVMNPSRVRFPPGAACRNAELMRRHKFHHVPLVDGKAGSRAGTARPAHRRGRVAERVVVMAGGRGTRLRPLTEDCPKPLLPVGGKPILEHILDAFIEEGFRHFFFSVNYKAEMITEHFGNGDRWGVRIDYLREASPLGTAGSLRCCPSVRDIRWWS